MMLDDAGSYTEVGWLYTSVMGHNLWMLLSLKHESDDNLCVFISE